MSKKYGEQLCEIGFLKFADPGTTDSLRLGVINAFDLYEAGSNKFAIVDAEELTEGNFGFFVPDLQKILKKRNFTLEVKSPNDFAPTGNIFINGTSISLCTKADLEAGMERDLAPRSFFKEVNRQLSAANINEAFYLVNGDNDLAVLLLTAGEYKIIAEFYKNDIKNTPYVP